MAFFPQSYLTTPQRVGIAAIKAGWDDSVPTEDQAQYADYLAFMAQTIPNVSEVLAEICGGLAFVPYYDEKRWFHVDLVDSSRYIARVWGRRLLLQQFLLEATAIEWAGTALDEYDTSTEEGDWIAMPQIEYPYTAIDFRADADSSLPLVGGFGKYVGITGWWGYHTNPSQLYVNVTADNAVTITDSGTELTVDDAEVYETYQYIRIEDELLFITARDEDNDKLTVERGVNGTTAAAHSSKQVQLVHPMRDVQDVANYFAHHAYLNRDPSSDTIQVLDESIIIPKFPERYDRTIKKYRSMAEGMLMGAL